MSRPPATPSPNPYERLVRRLGTQRWFASFGRHILTPIDRRLAPRGRSLTGLGTTFPLCHLTTTGRRSGASRTVPLLHIRHGEAVAVVGTNFGGAAHPAWVANLEADPDAHLEIPGEAAYPVRASRATPEEWRRLWPRFVAVWPGYAHYLERTDREVRMFLLHPATSR